MSYSRKQLTELKVSDLKDIAKSLQIEVIRGTKKNDIIELILLNSCSSGGAHSSLNTVSEEETNTEDYTSPSEENLSQIDAMDEDEDWETELGNGELTDDSFIDSDDD